MVAQLIPFSPSKLPRSGSGYFLAIDIIYHIKMGNLMGPLAQELEYQNIVDEIRALKKQGGAEWVKFINAFNMLVKEEISCDAIPVCVRDTHAGDGEPQPA